MSAINAHHPVRVGGRGYERLVLSLGPTGYWRSLRGGIVPDLALGNHGVAHAGVSAAPGIVTLDDAGAMRFDGSTGYVEIEDSPIYHDTSEVAVFAWVVTGFTGTPPEHKRIVTRWQTGDLDGYTFNIGIQDGDMVFSVYQDGSFFDAGSSWSGKPAGRYFVAGTYDGDRARLYVDGDQVAETSSIGGPLDVRSGKMWIGQGGTNSAIFPRYVWDGDIDEVAVFNRALPQSRIKAAHVAGLYGS